MPNPAVIPAPLALILFALLAAALVATDRYLRNEPLTPWTGQPWAAPAVRGRHRPGRIAQPLTVDDIRRIRRADRAKATLATLEEVAPGVIVFRNPLALEAGPTTEIAGLPDRQPPADTGTLHITSDIAAQSIHPAPCGFPEVVPCICAIVAAEDTRDLTPVA